MSEYCIGYDVNGTNLSSNLSTNLYVTESNNTITTWHYDGGSYVGSTYVSPNDDVESLKKEIKELRKIIANLSTLVLTHIGNEQSK